MYNDLQWEPTHPPCAANSLLSCSRHNWPHLANGSECDNWYNTQWFYDNNTCADYGFGDGVADGHAGSGGRGDVGRSPDKWSANATAGSTPPLPELGGEDLTFDDDGEVVESPHRNVDFGTFPVNFFANPFAVSFPDDLPCAGAPAFGFGMPPPNPSTMATTNLDQGRVAATGAEQASAKQTKGKGPTSHPKPTSAGPSMSPMGKVPSLTMALSPLPLSQKSSPDGQFHFIDSTDKKSAVRIRNTRISRQHKANKVKRIAELEALLEEALKRVETLEGRK